MRYITILLLVVIVAGCDQKKQQAEMAEATAEREVMAYSLGGEPFYEPERSDEVQDKLERNLAASRAAYEAEASEMNYIWLGRRTAYLSRYPEAIDIYSWGLGEYPESYKLYRHRGHRFISVRKFDKAIVDLEKAAALMPTDTLETEPDGIPNKLNKPLSSTQFNVYYHLGLAYYLTGQYEKAIDAYKKCMKTSVNDDLEVATADWMYMTFMRLGQRERADSLLATIGSDMEIIENDSYYKRLQMYQGKLSPEEVLSVNEHSADHDLALATQGYGVGNYYIEQGDVARGIKILEDVVAGDHWAAFGYIAAEADLYHMEKPEIP